MKSSLIALALSFIVAYFFIPVIIKIAKTKRLYDEPDERKVHSRPISSLGGVGIFAGFIFALLLSPGATQTQHLPFYASAGLVIFFLGLKDDIMVIKPFKKLVGQLIAAGILVHLAGVQIQNMYGFLGVGIIPSWLGISLSYFLIVLIINACNLIDGIDGLAGLLGLTILLFLGTYFLICGSVPNALLAFSLAGGLIAFLFYNMQPAKIFMGDGGSMLIGLVVAILVIRFINFAPFNSVLPLQSSPAIAFSMLVVPLMDTLRVFAIRMLQGHSPFRPDKNHVHHLLLRRKWSHQKIAVALCLANSVFIVIAVGAAHLNVNLLFLIITGLFFFSMGLITRTSISIKQGTLVLDKGAKASQPRAQVIPAQGVVAESN
jgi:UDP-N-acetylmuramyl pentapeptide phosphotransferase/UDP-N-acetylglucosamine-1-phosphate transferase